MGTARVPALLLLDREDLIVAALLFRAGPDRCEVLDLLEAFGDSCRDCESDEGNKPADNNGVFLVEVGMVSTGETPWKYESAPLRVIYIGVAGCDAFGKPD